MIANYFDVAAKAREMGMGNTELARELVEDGFDVVAVSARKFRVLVRDFECWLESRRQRLRDDIEQRRRRASFVKGETTPVPEQPRRVAFRR